MSQNPTDPKQEIEKTLGGCSEVVLKKIAMDFVDSKIFTTLHMGRDVENSLYCVFIVLAFMEDTKAYLQDAGFLFEYYDAQGVVAVNGYPTFFSCSKVIKSDMPAFLHYVEEYKKLKAAFQSAEPPKVLPKD